MSMLQSQLKLKTIILPVITRRPHMILLNSFHRPTAADEHLNSYQLQPKHTNRFISLNVIETFMLYVLSRFTVVHVIFTCNVSASNGMAFTDRSKTKRTDKLNSVKLTCAFCDAFGHNCSIDRRARYSTCLWNIIWWWWCEFRQINFSIRLYGMYSVFVYLVDCGVPTMRMTLFTCDCTICVINTLKWDKEQTGNMNYWSSSHLAIVIS